MPSASKQDPKGGTITLDEYRRRFGPPPEVRTWWMADIPPQPAEPPPARTVGADSHFVVPAELKQPKEPPRRKRRLARRDPDSLEWV